MQIFLLCVNRILCMYSFAFLYSLFNLLTAEDDVFFRAAFNVQRKLIISFRKISLSPLKFADRCVILYVYCYVQNVTDEVFDRRIFPWQIYRKCMTSGLKKQ